jgi:hypothetical protein
MVTFHVSWLNYDMILHCDPSTHSTILQSGLSALTWFLVYCFLSLDDTKYTINDWFFESYCCKVLKNFMFRLDKRKVLEVLMGEEK